MSIPLLLAIGGAAWAARRRQAGIATTTPTGPAPARPGPTVSATPRTPAAARARAPAVVALSDRGRFVRGRDRTRVVSGRPTPHWGVDIAASEGTPLRAVMPGVVRWVRPISGYGNTVAIQHGDRLSVLYAHMQTTAVAQGQRVRPGDLVGTVGRTTSGPGGRRPGHWRPGRAAQMRAHLHFEVHPHPQPALGRTQHRDDPVRWLRRHGIRMYAAEEARA
jgi:murein DD-endopeptidase MepM/ murein hydrolase activator NlpD